MHIQRPNFVQEQKHRMNAQLYQSIKLMELPIIDLRAKIEEEIERNPALEVLEDHTTVSLDDAYTISKEEDDYFEASSDSGFIARGTDDDTQKQYRFLEGVLARPETLQEHLLWQFMLHPITADIRRIGELLIQNLDADGFHKEPVELLLKNESKDKIAEAMQLIRSLDPPGTCTANYRESLNVQARLMLKAPRGIEDALEHLDLLEKNRYAELARRINRTEREARLIAERLRELSPFPGRQFSSDETRYVVPDVQVVKREGEFVIILNDEEIPVLGINPFFMQLSGGQPQSGGKSLSSGESVSERSPHSPENGFAFKNGSPPPNTETRNTITQGEEKPVRDFVRENIKEARWFIQSINQRNHTVLRVSRAIVEFQRPFFVNGPKYLAPLTLRDIAKELGVHETTVSRTSNGKYMQTEWGIFELRHFFTNSISGQGTSGSSYSKEGVKEIIREMITKEERRFTDKELADILAQKGIPIARRTVAKYRNELDVGSSYAR